MYICVCRGVTERALREAVAQGACSIPELAERLGLGTGCGRCLEEALAHVGPEALTSARRRDRAPALAAAL
jgi:bacterioferritin-associated ferredoxin